MGMGTSIDRGREGITKGKLLYGLSAAFFGPVRKPDVLLKKFGDFDVVALRARTGKKIRNILLDVDACIAPAYGPILPENLAKIDELSRDGVRVGIYSNCADMPRLAPLHERRIPIYDGTKEKPEAAGFLHACEIFSFDPRETWMVGENPATDGGAIGVLEGMALVEPIPAEMKYLTVWQMVKLAVQFPLRWFAIRRVRNF